MRRSFDPEASPRSIASALLVGLGLSFALGCGHLSKQMMLAFPALMLAGAFFDFASPASSAVASDLERVVFFFFFLVAVRPEEDLPSLVGAPWPMVVRQTTRLGRCVSARASASAFSIASGSWPSTSDTCQP